MITAAQIEILKPYMASEGIRPMLAKIWVNKGWLVACDSFRLIRTKLPGDVVFPDTKGYPDVDTFMATDIEWKNITKFMKKFTIRLGIFGRTNAILDGSLVFPPGKCLIEPRFIFDDSDGAKMTLDIDHPFEHTSMMTGYVLEMLKPFKKDLDKWQCTIEYRQKNPLGIIQFRIISYKGTYEVGIMPKKI
mgnify:FL=1